MPEPGLTPTPLRLLILDCDGVLIESGSNRLIVQECRAMGLDITDVQAMHRFAGKALHMIAAKLEAQDGIRMLPDWPDLMHGRLVAMLEQEATLIDGACTMLEAAVALGLPVRVASNSSHEEMAVKFRRTRLDRMLRERLHSARDVGRPKPWPDLFLSVAAAEGVGPEACLVVEDSDTGLRAAQAAGMACVVLRRDGSLPGWATADVQAAPVRQIRHLDALRPILLAATRTDSAI